MLRTLFARSGLQPQDVFVVDFQIGQLEVTYMQWLLAIFIRFSVLFVGT